MSMWHIANRKVAEAVGRESIEVARGLIATAFLKGTIPDTTQHRIHQQLPDAQTETAGNIATSEDGEQDRHIDNEDDGIKNEDVDNLRSDCGKKSDEKRHEKGGNLNAIYTIDERIAINSLEPGKWLTCTVIDRQNSSLRTIDERTAYQPASILTRYFDMTQTHDLHLILHDVHGPRLLQYEKISVLVARLWHWASI